MDNKMTYIYSLSHPLTGEIRYVGKANKLKDRLRCHINEKGKSHRKNWIDQLKENGLKPVMEVIDFVEQDNWQFWEQVYISLFKSWGFILVNGTGGGEGRVSAKHSEATRKKMSESLKKTYANPDLRRKMSEMVKGRKLSDDTKKKLSELNSGSNNPFFGKPLSEQHKENIRKRHLGRVYSEETLDRMKKAKRPPITEEAKRKMSVSRIGNKNALGLIHSAESRKKISDSLTAMYQKRREAACQTV